MNIVIDTNVIISALCFPFSIPRKAFDLAKQISKVVFSIDTLNELQKVLNRKKFDRYINLEQREQFIKSYEESSKLIQIRNYIIKSRDLNDNKFLELAVSAKAKYIISGDEDLLVLNPFENIHIIKPAEFIFQNIHFL